LVFSDDIWTAGLQPVLCAVRDVARCVCCARRAVLLEDESGEQPAIALKER